MSNADFKRPAHREALAVLSSLDCTFLDIEDAVAGLAIARTAYGNAILRSLVAVVDKIRKDRVYRNRCIEGLAVIDTKTLAAGLKTIAAVDQ